MATTPPSQNPLTKNVRLAIFEAGVSRAKVAGALGVTPRTLYSKLRTGKFTVEQLQAVAKVTGTTVKDLLPDEAKAAS